MKNLLKRLKKSRNQKKRDNDAAMTIDARTTFQR